MGSDGKNRHAPLRVLALVALLCAGLAPRAHAQQLYWLDTNYSNPALHRANVDGTQATAIALTPGTLPEGLTLDGSGGRLYWTEAAYANARIMSAPPSLASTAAVVTGMSSLRGIAVGGSSLYWTSSNLATGPLVRRSTLAGASITTLVSPGPGANPRGIALDLAGGRMYYADFDGNAIVRANLDGSNAGVFLETGLGSAPYGVAFDAVAQRLYWTEYGTGQVRACNTNGSGLTPLYSGLVNPTYIALDRASATLYWIEAGAGGQRIRRAPSFGGAVTTLPLPVTTYGGIVFAPVGTLAAGSPGPPRAFSLSPVWPNPARGSATIEYALPHDAGVRLTVTDVQGRAVASLADGIETAGTHRVDWSAAGARGRLAAGLYFVTLRAEGRTWVRRVAVTE